MKALREKLGFLLKRWSVIRRRTSASSVAKKVVSQRVFPKLHEKNDSPRVAKVQTLKEDDHSKCSPLSYACGKIRKHDSLMRFDPGSTHKPIFAKLATKLGIHDFKMGDIIQANGAFKMQEILMTPLIGKERLHIQ